VQIKYSIFDEKKNEIFSEIKTYSVDENLSYKEFLDELKLKPGEYTLQVQVIYDGEKKAEAKQQFFIINKEENGSQRLALEIKYNLPLYFMLFIFLSLILIILISSLRRKGEIDILIKEGKEEIYKGNLENALDIYPVLKNLYKKKYSGNSKVYNKINIYHEFLLKSVKNRIKE
jgi:hypothetical protein